ncbi:hypothetical protein MPER_12466 [Moniliophthora perniciosa FA553]|nr:hypothetical protein MPER_12466 [Moniliophthora perniciosa FA553]
MAVGTHDEVYKEKLVVLHELDTYATTKDHAFLERIIMIWACWWCDFRSQNKALAFKTPFKEESSSYFINGLVDVIEQTSLPVPIAIDWLSVEVPASLWRQYQERHALHSETQ